MTDRDSRGHRRRLRPGDIVVARPDFCVTARNIGGKRFEVMGMGYGGRWKLGALYPPTWHVMRLLRHELRFVKRPKKAS